MSNARDYDTLTKLTAIIIIAVVIYSTFNFFIFLDVKHKVDKLPTNESVYNDGYQKAILDYHGSLLFQVKTLGCFDIYDPQTSNSIKVCSISTERGLNNESIKN